MDKGPEFVKGGLLRRGLALLVDLLVAEVLIQLLAAVLFPLSGGALVDTNSIFTSCEPSLRTPPGIELPAEFKAAPASDCTKSLFGWPTARLHVVSRQNPGSPVTTSLTYAVGRDGRATQVFDLAVLQALVLVGMRWLLERLGRRSLGRKFLSIRVVPRWSENWQGNERSGLTRRYVLFGLPLLPAPLLGVAAALFGKAGGPALAEALSVLSLLANLPLLIALFAAASAVLRGHDAFYDEAAGTTVARFVDNAVEVAPERSARAERAWLVGPGGRRALRFATPWMSCGLAAVLTIVYLAELALSFQQTRALGVTGQTLVLFGGMDRELVLQAGQIYRLATAIFVHGNAPHLVVNAVVLLVVGWLIEGLLGRGWLLAVFLLGGLAASLTSITFNPPGMLSVGASGGITALLACGLVLSLRLDDDQRRLWLRAFCTACLFTAFQASGTVQGAAIDRADHLGGAAGGLVIGLVILAAWRPGQLRPSWPWPAAGVGVATCAALFASVPLHGFGDAPMAALLVPPTQLPQTDAEWMARSADLVQRYPRDPRAHLARAMAAGDDRGQREAEMVRSVAAQLVLAPSDRSKVEENVDITVGRTRQAAGDWAAAQDLFGRAIATAPPGATEALSRRAEVEERQGEFGQALRDIEALERREPTNLAWRLDDASVAFMEDQPDKALWKVDAALSLAPDDGLALRQRGLLAFYAGRPGEAVHSLERAASLLPKDAYAALWLDMVAVRSGYPERMKALAKDIDTSVWPGPVIKLYLGEANGTTMLAAADNPDPIKRSEQRCEADFYYGEWLLMQETPSEAGEHLKAAASNCPKTFYEWAAVNAELHGDAGFRAK